MRFIFLFIGMLLFSVNHAQSAAKPDAPAPAVTIGYFNYDSILNLVPGYKRTQDSLTADKERLEEMKVELNRKQTEYNQLKNKLSPTIMAIKEAELLDLRIKLEDFSDQVHNRNYDAKLQGYHLKLTAAAKKVANAKSYASVIDSKNRTEQIIFQTSGVIYENMTVAICKELGINQ